MRTKPNSHLNFAQVPIQCGFKSSKGVYYRKLDARHAICISGRRRGSIGIFVHPRTGNPDWIQYKDPNPLRWDFACNVKPGRRVVNLETVWDITQSPEALPPLTPVLPMRNTK